MRRIKLDRQSATKTIGLPALAAAVLLSVGAASGWAKGPFGPGQPAEINIAEAQARAAEAFGAADSNGDGLISQDEFSVLKHQGQRRGHGPRGRHRDHAELSDEERAERREARRAQRAERRAQNSEAAFAALDADGDGSVSADEFQNRKAVRKQKMKERAFARMDINDDGVLDSQEFPPRIAQLPALDVNGDGVVDRSEMPRRHRGGFERPNAADAPDA